MPDSAAALRHLQKASDYDALEAEHARLRARIGGARLDLQTLRRRGDIGVAAFYRVDALFGNLLPDASEPANAEEKLLHDWKRVMKDPRGSYWRCRRCGAQENGWVVRPKLSGCSANAEGIASEGGTAKAANPRGLGTDAPSAEAACDHAKHLPSIVGSQEGDTATCRCGLRVVAVHEESEGAWWEPMDEPTAEAGQPTTEGGDASCPVDTESPTRRPPSCSPAPSPTGGGIEDRLREEVARYEPDLRMLAAADRAEPSPTGGGAEERYEKMQRESAEWSARVQASIDALTQPDQPDWQALAGELAVWVRGHGHVRCPSMIMDDNDPEGDLYRRCTCGRNDLLDRYHEALAQHSGEET